MRCWTSTRSGRPHVAANARRRRINRGSISFIATLGLGILIVSGCSRSDVRLDGVERLAYSVKPAVVRVNALATAEFSYPIAAISEIAREIGTTPRDLPGASSRVASVKTGSGRSGSGFIVHHDGTIVTSAHVVASTRDPAAVQQDLMTNGSLAALLRHFPEETLRAIHRDGKLNALASSLSRKGSLKAWEIRNEVLLSNGDPHPFSIISYSPPLHQKGSDLAVLAIKRDNLPTLILGDSDRVQVGSSVWAVGYPAVASSTDEIIGGWLSKESDLEATLNPGYITAIKQNAANTRVFQSNVAIYQGNSGGPVVDQEGRVIAISTWGHTSAEQIRFLVPVNLARTILANAKVPVNEPGTFDRSYRNALEEAGKGSWAGARRELGAASVFFQGSPDLIRFRSDAERAIQARPLWAHPAVAAAAAAVIVLPLVTILLLKWRRPATPAIRVSNEPATRVNPASRSQLDGMTEALPMANGFDSLLGKLTILNGERAGEKLGLGGSGIRIGRESSVCEIVFENPKVSRLHAEIVLLDGKVLLIDRNSSNGTFVNDRKIERQALRDGDIIYFGGRNAIAVAFHA
ncbi:MAG TPA: trypsin-like peptidase domain-containing protein [Thermoanaerobaculia bacterium]|nr:trypsin-like peptidase domain-containing protein [Thermoanaerobaculia bacterium]